MTVWGCWCVSATSFAPHPCTWTKLSKAATTKTDLDSLQPCLFLVWMGILWYGNPLFLTSGRLSRVLSTTSTPTRTSRHTSITLLSRCVTTRPLWISRWRIKASGRFKAASTSTSPLDSMHAPVFSMDYCISSLVTDRYRRIRQCPVCASKASCGGSSKRV